MSGIHPSNVAAEIESVIAALSESPDQSAARHAQRLVDLVLALHGEGFTRILDIVGGEAGGALLDRLANDPLVSSLCALHGLQLRRDPGLLQIIRSPHRSMPHQRMTEGRCDLCQAALDADHGHVVDVETRRLLCACSTCRGAGGRFRHIPTRYLHLPSMRIAPPRWDALGIPVGVAFLFINSHLGRPVACYPGAAGATESELPLTAWPELVAEYPWIDTLVPDVEALLVRRVEDDFRAYIVPIDACYELVGRVRTAWSGFGGGAAVEAEVEQFCGDVLRRATQDAHTVT